VRLWRVQKDGFTDSIKGLGALDKNTVTAAWHEPVLLDCFEGLIVE